MTSSFTSMNTTMASLKTALEGAVSGMSASDADDTIVQRVLQVASATCANVFERREQLMLAHVTLTSLAAHAWAAKESKSVKMYERAASLALAGFDRLAGTADTFSGVSGRRQRAREAAVAQIQRKLGYEHGAQAMAAAFQPAMAGLTAAVERSAAAAERSALAAEKSVAMAEAQATAQAKAVEMFATAAVAAVEKAEARASAFEAALAAQTSALEGLTKALLAKTKP